MKILNILGMLWYISASIDGFILDYTYLRFSKERGGNYVRVFGITYCATWENASTRFTLTLDPINASKNNSSNSNNNNKKKKKKKNNNPLTWIDGVKPSQ